MTPVPTARRPGPAGALGLFGRAAVRPRPGGYAVAGEVWQLALLATLWGLGIEAFQVVWDTSLQELVRPEALGRVSSLDHIGSLALLPVSFAVVGAVADRTGARPVFALAGLARPR